MSQDSDDSGVLLQLFNGSLNGSSSFSGVLGGVLGEGKLLGVAPVLVEATLDIISQVFSKQGSNLTQTTRGWDVTDNTTNDHGRAFDDGDSFQDFLLVHLGTGAFEITNNVSHTSLETHESGQVDGLGAVVAGEGLDATLMTLAALTRQETERTMTRSFKFTMRLKMD